jgi:hypothetical protein
MDVCVVFFFWQVLNECFFKRKKIKKTLLTKCLNLYFVQALKEKKYKKSIIIIIIA